ncbi:hypothetical protein H4696_002491 [Amycolatopsis lexingtonensis]|uniref:Uncharacterized protein n=2 Tax=Amycolatopsis lexingtonensis TaxID=218822 RepID=A0ABR9HWR7_9PSEU|nr:hypothetical protein [Amycolatopsis lexingtonensis]MBE1495391.1 hypothetical protein [Amycolatopsis lexingtonensis]
MPEGNPLVADSKQDPDGPGAFTAGNGDYGWAGGIGIAESSMDAFNGIKDGDWVSGGLGMLSLAGEIAGAAIDPFGYLMSSVASFLMEHVQPLKDMLDSVAGNPPVIQSYADTWGNVSKALGERKTDFDNAVKNGTTGWTGAGADAYRKFAAEHSEALSGAATVAGAISTVTMIMGQVVSFVRETVRQLIADLVGKLIAWVMEEVFSLGFGTPVVVAQASAAIAKWGKKIGELLKKLTDTIRKVSPLLSKLVDVFEKIAKVFGKVLGKVSGLDGLKVKEGGFVHKIPKGEGGGVHARAHGDSPDGEGSHSGDGSSGGDESGHPDGDSPSSDPMNTESSPEAGSRRGSGQDGSSSRAGDDSPAAHGGEPDGSPSATRTEEGAPGRGGDSSPSHAGDSTPSRAGEGSSPTRSPSHSDDSSPSPARGGEPSHSGDSSPSRAGDNGPSHAADSAPSRASDSSPSPTRSSEPSRAGDSSPSPTRGSEPSHVGDSGPSPARGSDSTPSHASDNTPARASDASPSPTRSSEPSHASDSSPSPTRSEPSHAGDSSPSPARGGDPSPARSAPDGHTGTDSPSSVAPARPDGTTSASGTAPTAPRTSDPVPAPRGADSPGVPPQGGAPMAGGMPPGGAPAAGGGGLGGGGTPRTSGGGWTGTPGSPGAHTPDAPGRPRTGNDLPPSRPRTPEAPAPAARGYRPDTHTPGARPGANTSPTRPGTHAPGARPGADGHAPGTHSPDSNGHGPHDNSPGHHGADDPDTGTPHHNEPLTPDEINTRHAEHTPAGTSYHAGDPDLGDLPHRVQPDPDGRYTVDVHVTPDGHARIGDRLYTPEQFADILRRNTDYDGRPIRLIGCDASSNDFAHRLSRELDTEVLAPTRPAWTDSHGRVFSSDYEIGPDGRMRPRIPPDGEWNTHHPDGTTHRHGDDGFAPGSHDADADTARARGDDAHKKKVHEELLEKLNKHDDEAKELLRKYWRQIEGDDQVISRRRTNAEHEGVELPVLRRNENGDYEIHQPANAGNNVRSEFIDGSRRTGGRDTAPPELLEDADILAAGRPHIWSYLDEANHSVRGTPLPDSRFETPLDEFDQAGFNDVQSNHWNNKLGELAADHAVGDGLGRAEFADRPLRPVDVPDRGAHHFDRVYQDPDGNYVIVEAKGPSAGYNANGGYQQGHPEYVRNVIAKMIERGEPEAAHAHLMQKQLDEGKLRYFYVKAQVEKPDLTGYTDEQLRAMPAAQRPADRYAGYAASEFDLSLTTRRP